MQERYKRFNEVTFDAYCKAAIDKSILKERKRKSEQNQKELTFSMLDNETLNMIVNTEDDIEALTKNCKTFYILGKVIGVQDEWLGNALFSLLPKDRTIILLYYFESMRDEQIAQAIHSSRATVQRRRNIAKQKLKDYMGNRI